MGLETVLGLVTAGLGVKNAIDSSNRADSYSVQDPISWEEAMQQATQIQDPLYDEKMDNTMQQTDYRNMARGFYGQLPGDVLKKERAVAVDRARQSAIAELASSMQNNSQNAYVQQLSAKENAENAANQNLLSALGAISNLPALPTLGGVFGESGSTSNTDSGTSTEISSPLKYTSIGQPLDLTGFGNDNQEDTSGFESIYKSATKNKKPKGEFGDYTNPYGG